MRTLYQGRSRAKAADERAWEKQMRRATKNEVQFYTDATAQAVVALDGTTGARLGEHPIPQQQASGRAGPTAQTKRKIK